MFFDWGDETSIETGDIRGKGYAPRGNTPIVKDTEIKVKVSMISAITNQDKVFWKLHICILCMNNPDKSRRLDLYLAAENLKKFLFKICVLAKTEDRF